MEGVKCCDAAFAQRALIIPAKRNRLNLERSAVVLLKHLHCQSRGGVVMKVRRDIGDADLVVHIDGQLVGHDFWSITQAVRFCASQLQSWLIHVGKQCAWVNGLDAGA